MSATQSHEIVSELTAFADRPISLNVYHHLYRCLVREIVRRRDRRHRNIMTAADACRLVNRIAADVDAGAHYVLAIRRNAPGPIGDKMLECLDVSPGYYRGVV